MLCLSGDKIMPEVDICQAFPAFFSKGLLYNKSISYDMIASKCFKYRRK